MARWPLTVLLALILIGCAATSSLVPTTFHSEATLARPDSIVEKATVPRYERDEARPPASTLGMDVDSDAASYGMLYVPSAGRGVQLVTDLALNQLFEDALPGYGLYTFVLLGAGFEHSSGNARARHSELFRMIETYVVTPDATEGPSTAAHVFLVPIRAGRSPMAPLVKLVAVDLSNLMRLQVSEFLRQRGQARLAARIERGAGPFLVTGLEPSLLPLDRAAPRLIADLSGLGPEHLYTLIDAYDRDIPPELSGRPESLSALRRRLLELAHQLQLADGRGWIFSL